MQHNHENVISSPEADRIESSIETHLYHLSALINELQNRISNRVKPEKLLSQRWVWLVIVSLYLAARISSAIEKHAKKVRQNRACLQAINALKLKRNLSDQKKAKVCRH